MVMYMIIVFKFKSTGKIHVLNNVANSVQGKYMHVRIKIAPSEDEREQ